MRHFVSFIGLWAFLLCLNMTPGSEADQYSDALFLFGLNSNSNKKQAASKSSSTHTGRQYLSDVIRKLETSSLILNSQREMMANNNPDEDDELDEENFDEDSNHDSTTTGNVKSWMCRPIYRRIRSYRQSARFSEHCQPLTDYQLVECMGYCHSQSMLWKNKDELTTAACCSMSHVNHRTTRIYCTRPIEPDEIHVDAQLRYLFKDKDMIDMFKNSFTRSAWTSELSSSSSNNQPSKSTNSNVRYTGYYSILVYYNATCECEFV